MKRSVLVIVRNVDGEVLLFQKLKGQGQGFWNFPGGKVQPEESFFQAAQRELAEETGLQATDWTVLGDLIFRFPKDSQTWSSECVVFAASAPQSRPLQSSDEGVPQWVSIKKIPLSQMWPGDRLWVPQALRREQFSWTLEFDSTQALTQFERVRPRARE
jgi:8-oxo-dGTP diphosphatase